MTRKPPPPHSFGQIVDPTKSSKWKKRCRDCGQPRSSHERDPRRGRHAR